jgi:hypothetical protein
MGATSPKRKTTADDLLDWAEAHIQIARMTLTIKLDRNLRAGSCECANCPAGVTLIPEPFSCKSNPRPQRLGLKVLQHNTDSY